VYKYPIGEVIVFAKDVIEYLPDEGFAPEIVGKRGEKATVLRYSKAFDFVVIGHDLREICVNHDEIMSEKRWELNN